MRQHDHDGSIERHQDGQRKDQPDERRGSTSAPKEHSESAGQGTPEVQQRLDALTKKGGDTETEFPDWAFNTDRTLAAIWLDRLHDRLDKLQLGFPDAAHNLDRINDTIEGLASSLTNPEPMLRHALDVVGPHLLTDPTATPEESCARFYHEMLVNPYRRLVAAFPRLASDLQELRKVILHSLDLDPKDLITHTYAPLYTDPRSHDELAAVILNVARDFDQRGREREARTLMTLSRSVRSAGHDTAT